MMGGDHGGKLVKNLRSAAQKYVGVGFFLGFFLVLLTYFTLSEQFAIAAPNGEFFRSSDEFCCSLLHALSGPASIVHLKSCDHFSLVQPKAPLINLRICF
jgi:hypothetical protein